MPPSSPSRWTATTDAAGRILVQLLPFVSYLPDGMYYEMEWEDPTGEYPYGHSQLIRVLDINGLSVHDPRMQVKKKS